MAYKLIITETELELKSEKSSVVELKQLIGDLEYAKSQVIKLIEQYGHSVLKSEEIHDDKHSNNGRDS